jgi:hypothetical protein
MVRVFALYEALISICGEMGVFNNGKYLHVYGGRDFCCGPG